MYFNRAYELFHEKNCHKIFIKGLGITTKSAVNISLIIMDKISNLKIKNVETSTIIIKDDIIDIGNCKFFNMCLPHSLNLS